MNTYSVKYICFKDLSYSILIYTLVQSYNYASYQIIMLNICIMKLYLKIIMHSLIILCRQYTVKARPIYHIQCCIRVVNTCIAHRVIAIMYLYNKIVTQNNACLRSCN